MPIFFSMMTKWIPRKERTVVAVIIFPTALFGRVITMYFTEVILRLSVWKTVFYVYGVIGIVWALLLVTKIIYLILNIRNTIKIYIEIIC